MKLNALFATVALLVLAGMPSAQARPYEGAVTDGWSQSSASGTHHRAKAFRSYRNDRSDRVAGGGLGGRPSAWCGWWMRSQKGGGPSLNLAANWRGWGHSASPQVGAVVVWSHHVGMITGRASNGQWIVKSGNDGGRVRERARSIAGAVVRVG